MFSYYKQSQHDIKNSGNNFAVTEKNRNSKKESNL